MFAATRWDKCSRIDGRRDRRWTKNSHPRFGSSLLLSPVASRPLASAAHGDSSGRERNAHSVKSYCRDGTAGDGHRSGFARVAAVRSAANQRGEPAQKRPRPGLHFNAASVPTVSTCDVARYHASARLLPSARKGSQGAAVFGISLMPPSPNRIERSRWVGMISGPVPSGLFGNVITRKSRYSLP